MPSYLANDQTRLHYLDEGEGHPVIALAGLTRNAADFDHVAKHLTGVRLIRPDYRGRGLSEWADYKTYTIPQEAADTIALMDHLGLERATILGTSRGGLIAMLLAATAKHRLAGVILNDIGPMIDPKGLAVISDYIGRKPAAKSYEEAAELRARTWKHFANVPMERWLSEVRGQYIEKNGGLLLRYDPKLRDAVLGGGEQPVPDLWPLFDALSDIPLGLIRGANSDLLSIETTEEMARRHPDMLWANIPDRGHVPFLDEPEALAIIHDIIERSSQ